MRCNVIVTYLFSAEVTPPMTSVAFFRYVLSSCEKTVQDFEITTMDSFYESGYVLSNDSKISTQLDPFSSSSLHLGTQEHGGFET